jgi:hypothetical protein
MNEMDLADRSAASKTDVLMALMMMVTLMMMEAQKGVDEMDARKWAIMSASRVDHVGGQLEFTLIAGLSGNLIRSL